MGCPQLYDVHTVTTNISNMCHFLIGKRHIQDMPLMLSDPLDSSSSDTMSFDEEDMFGSDSDIEIISLPSGSQDEVENAQDNMVCTYVDCMERHHFISVSGPFE